jgi:hypothetical protein
MFPKEQVFNRTQPTTSAGAISLDIFQIPQQPLTMLLVEEEPFCGSGINK